MILSQRKTNQKIENKETLQKKCGPRSAILYKLAI